MNIVKNLVDKHEMAKYRIAKIVGVSWNTVQNWYKNIYIPTEENQKKIKKLLRKIIPLIFLLTLIPSCSPAFSQDINWDKLVQSVITCESSGRPHAVSKAGAIGLMGIMPQGALAEWNMCNTRQYTIGDLYNPSINVEIGTFYLKRLYHYYKCTSVELICAGYNGGITRLRLNNFNIDKMPRETRNYVKRILKEYN